MFVNNAPVPKYIAKHLIIVSSGAIWFSVYYAAVAAAHREIFNFNTLRGKLHQLDSPKFAGYLHCEVSFSGSLILTYKLAAVGISLKIFLFYWLVLISRRLNLFIVDMFNRYTCPLQHCRHLTLELLIQGHPRNAKVPHVGLACETNL